MSIDEYLRSTLRDFRLSRGEKRILNSIIEELGAGDHELAVYRNRAFEIAREELIDPTAPKVLDWLEAVVKALQPAPAEKASVNEVHFSPDADCPNRIGRLLKSSHKTVDICVFTITDDRISREIEGAHRRGVKLRIITDDDKAGDLGSDIERLSNAGVPVAVDRTRYHMHHKFAIFDRKKLLTGSYNWTRSAAEHNEENFIITDDRSLITEFSGQFEKLWDSLS